MHIGIAGVVSYFEVFSLGLDSARVSNQKELFTYTIKTAHFNPAINGTDLNAYNSTLQPCPSPPQQDHPACNFYDTKAGHYFGFYTPLKIGFVFLSIFYHPTISASVLPIYDANQIYPILGSPFKTPIIAITPHAENSFIRGEIYTYMHLFVFVYTNSFTYVYTTRDLSIH